MIRQSYVIKFTLALLLIVVIITAVGVFVQTNAATTLDQDVERQLTQETVSDAQRLSEWISGNEKPVLMVSDRQPLANSTDKQQEYIERALENQLPDRASAVHLVRTTTETIVASTDQERIGENARETPWGPLIGGVDVDNIRSSDPFTNPEGDRVVVVTSLARQNLSLMVAVEYDTTAVTEQFSEGIDGTFTEVIKPTSQGTGILFSDFGYTDKSTELRPYVPDRTASDIPEMNPSSGGQFYNSPTKNSQLSDGYVAAAAPIEGSDWVLIKHAPKGNAFQLKNQITQGIVMFIGVALLGVLLVGGFVGRNTAVSIRDLSDKATRLEEGDLDVEVESSRKDEIGQLYESFDAMRKSLKQQIEEAQAAREEAETARKEAEVAREEAEQQREILQEAADNYKEVMSKCADGDLTQRLEPDERNDAMKEIAKEFNEMINQIEGTVAQVKQFSEEVSDTSEVVLQSTSELKDASGQIAESAQIITDEADELQAEINTVSQELEEPVERLEAGETETAIDQLAEISDSLSDLADRTGDALTEAESIAAATEQQTAALSEVTETARSLDRSAGPLNDLLNKFENSDDQTFYFGESSSPGQRAEGEEDD